MEFEAIGSWLAKPDSETRRASTPLPTKSRTTAAARAPDSSQLEGYCEPEIGCESVWPSTTTGCLRSSRTTPAILSTSLIARRLERRGARIEEDLVGEQLDDEPAAAHGDLDAALQAGVLGEVVDPALERAEVLLLLLGLGLGLGRRTVALVLLIAVSGRSDGSGGCGAACAVASERAAGHDRLAAVQDGAGERVLKRALQRLELRRVHRGDREQHHEEAEQERHHVREGHEPALLVLVLLLVVAAPYGDDGGTP